MDNVQCKPFVKWAGGKTQLLSTLVSHLPDNFSSSVNVYCEPFVGGGALLFHLLRGGFCPERIIINDSNKDLITLYRAIKFDVYHLILALRHLQSDYGKIRNEEDRNRYYMWVRGQYNNADKTNNLVELAAQFLFLNKTCFNGLYRVNSKGEFNVPFGKYVNPQICDEELLKEDSRVLQNVEIRGGDYQSVLWEADKNWFIYFDPPYRPLNATSNFTAYTKNGFDDEQQKQLATTCRVLNDKGARWMLSNSDPTSVNPDDKFFDDLYANFKITRVLASRCVNSKSEKRGKINEILVQNY